MTKRIFRSIFSVSAVILVISIGLIMGLLYGHFGDQLVRWKMTVWRVLTGFPKQESV